jgi:hypothetical protein
MPQHVSSTMCSSSGGQNCIIHPLVTLILVINQLDAQNLFYNKFISCLNMFRAPCAHRQEVEIVLYNLWYHHTYRWPAAAQGERGLRHPVHRTATYRCDDTRGCIIQFRPPDDKQMVLETCRGMKKTYCKTKLCASSWLTV